MVYLQQTKRHQQCLLEWNIADAPADAGGRQFFIDCKPQLEVAVQADRADLQLHWALRRRQLPAHADFEDLNKAV